MQSTAIAALIYMGKIDKPDYSVMVDTGFEKSAVMDYVNSVTVPKMNEIGIDLSIIKTSDYVTQKLINDDGYCIIPVFKKADRGNCKLKTCCNDKWKVNVIRKWLLENSVEQYVQLIGISTDEKQRQRKPHKKYYANRYPLIELGMSRDDCLDCIKAIGWPEPQRSSCYICGQQTEGQWWRLAVTAPKDFSKAVAVEKSLQRIDKNIYLHRGCKPLDETFKL